MQAVGAKRLEGSQELGEVVFVSQSSAKGVPLHVVRAASFGVVVGDVVLNHFSRQTC